MDEYLVGGIDPVQSCEGDSCRYGFACAPMDLGDQLHDGRVADAFHESDLARARRNLWPSEKESYARWIRRGKIT